MQKGIDLLPALADDPNRWRQELALQTALAVALLAWKGQGATETGHAYVRARELCERLGDTTALIRTLYGLSAYHCGRGELVTARRIATEMLQLSQHQSDATSCAVSNGVLGACLHWLGEFVSAREHLEQALDPCIAEGHHSLVLTATGVDPRTVALAYSALDLLILGYPEQASSRIEYALARSRKGQHPFSLALTLLLAAELHLVQRTERQAESLLDEVIALATEQRFPFWRGAAKTLRGRALAARGRTAEGLALARQGFQEFSATGAGLNNTHLLGILAQNCEGEGKTDEALDLLMRALGVADDRAERWFEAELHRLKGDWFTARRPTEQAEAEACFQRAIEVAQAQDAKLWELRASIRLARLWRKHGRGDEARALLGPIYAWFTEGFHTPDVTEARALLDELAAASPVLRNDTLGA